ncbi:hypothetical protein M419DRAFT_125463 [Trichoderma reesei RUT C-30]|uniref:Uncharacterized protein n=1 Tax=Hypocrea jecorina (strain ATCC 56765 / BCRC 32924 / NRRL 11460 / Rut C-30) TaxID=1344414 RepID=A0A024RV10_HYPJR|nr:hypothetical protein M419DRAFT_125463 [Trichoderma reesei RUT C-30]
MAGFDEARNIGFGLASYGRHGALRLCEKFVLYTGLGAGTARPGDLSRPLFSGPDPIELWDGVSG